MTFLETLILGSYLYTTAVFVWFTKWERQRVTNHLAHLTVQMKEVVATSVTAAIAAQALALRVTDPEEPSDTPPPPPRQSI